MPYTFLHAAEQSDEMNPQQIKLQECLKECWGVDPHTTAFLCQYFKPFFDNTNYHNLIEDFLNKSVKLNIQFPLDKKLIYLPFYDGVIQATKFHPVVYETPYVRIMAGCAAPEEREPFHTHIWKSLLVVFEEASYYVEYANGSSEFLNLRPGIYELPPEDLYACTNVGKNKENCLRFEVKENNEFTQTSEVNTLINNNSIEENDVEIFEKKIAYFFCVDNEEPVVEAYMSALQKLKIIERNSVELLEKEMIPYLEKAYQSIEQQRNWKFDTHEAAKIEFQIILGNLNGAPFEVIQDLMIQLYTIVFQSDSPLIQKAACLRTFLYQYKARLLMSEGKLSERDQRIMLEIAKTSKEFLNSIK